MTTEKIKVTYWDGDNPDVYHNDKKLNEKEIVDLLVKYMEENSKQYQEINQLKEQIIIYEKFLDGNDLDIEWDLFCTADICEEEEDMDCKYCKHMRWKE